MFWRLQENILEKADIDTLVDFIRTTDRFTQFTKVREFEDAWSAWQGSRYSVFVNSGSSANLVMIAAAKDRYGWKAGDEVLVPAVTWVTNISPIIQLGLTPVFVDVNLKDFSFDYESLEKKITARTRAIFITHLLGFPADIKKIKEIVGDRDIRILEDCCESHGAVYQGEKVGNFGEMSSFSFYWGHHMTSVEGGIISTNDEAFYHAALLKRSHGLARELPATAHKKYKEAYPDIDFNFLFLTDGFNFRNTEFNAVLGVSQLKHLSHYIEIRQQNFKQFVELCAPYRDVLHPLDIHEGISSFSLPFIFKDPEQKKKFQQVLGESGIESRPIIGGNLLRQPFLKGYGKPEDFPNADLMHHNGFYVGNNQFVNAERLQILKEILRKFFS